MVELVALPYAEYLRSGAGHLAEEAGALRLDGRSLLVLLRSSHGRGRAVLLGSRRSGGRRAGRGPGRGSRASAGSVARHCDGLWFEGCCG